MDVAGSGLASVTVVRLQYNISISAVNFIKLCIPCDGYAGGMSVRAKLCTASKPVLSFDKIKYKT